MLEAASGPRVQTLGTPWSVLQAIETVIGRRFTLDVCAAEDSAKAKRYFDVHADGLAQNWDGLCWCNPPYKSIDPWVRKAHFEAEAGRAQTVFLLPARTGTEWFLFCRRLERQGRCTIAFPRRRIRFNGSGDKPYEFSVVIGMGNSFAGLSRIEDMGAGFPVKD